MYLVLVGVGAGLAWGGVRVWQHLHAPDPVSASAFGVVPDDGGDDTVALQRALDGLKPGETLQFAPGRYLHSDVLVVRVPGVTLSGPAEIIASNETQSAVRVDADNVTIEQLTLGVTATTKRYSERAQHKLWLSGHSGIVVRDVTITGSAASGVFVEGTSRFQLVDVTVSDTRADGIHMTAGARDGVVDHPVVSRTGDDGVAVVSYDRDPAICRSIQIRSPEVHGTTWGRGLSVVGGDDITYTDVLVQDTDAAAIYVAVEGNPFYSQGVNGVTFRGGRLDRANRNAEIDHGAIVILSNRPDVTMAEIEVADLEVADTRPSASHEVGVIASDGGAVPQGLEFRELQFEGGPAQQFGGNAPVGTYRVD